MKKIIGEEGTGKTRSLMELASAEEGVLVCANPVHAREKAYTWGLLNIEFISYNDFIFNFKNITKPVFIDEIDTLCFKYCNVKAFTLSVEEDD